MKYKIISGRYETGDFIQQKYFRELFGEEDIQFKFDLYFHWFNIIHEVGHCLVDMVKTDHLLMDQIEEELFVNRFAVAYWRMIDNSGNLRYLGNMLEDIIKQLPNPVPDNHDFISFFRDIWGKEELESVMLYGYFQLSCVLQAMEFKGDLWDVLREIDITISPRQLFKTDTSEVSPEGAKKCWIYV